MLHPHPNYVFFSLCMWYMYSYILPTCICLIVNSILLPTICGAHHDSLMQQSDIGVRRQATRPVIQKSLIQAPLQSLDEKKSCQPLDKAHLYMYINCLSSPSYTGYQLLLRVKLVPCPGGINDSILYITTLSGDKHLP